MREREESTKGRTPGRNWAVAGIATGALALFLVPFFLGPLGMLFGLIGFARGDRRRGKIAVGVSVFSLILGSVLYILFRGLAEGA